MTINLTPVAKHDLLLSDSPSILASMDQVLTNLCLIPSIKSRKVAVVYTYQEDSPTTMLCSKLEVIGYCPVHVASSLLSISDKWHSCHLGVKRADGAYRSMLNADSLKNSSDFEGFIKNKLLSPCRAAIIGCDSKGRCGFITCTLLDVRNASSTTTPRKEEYSAWEYFASCYVIQIDEIRDGNLKVSELEELESTKPADTLSQTVVTIEEVQLWKPPEVADDDLTLHPQMTLSSMSNTFSSFINQTTDDATTPSSNVNRKRHHSQLEKSEQVKNDSFHSNSGAAAADQFYSNLTRSLDTRSSSRLFHMRNFNGWVKACQISELTPQTGSIHKIPLNNTLRKSSAKHNHPLRVLDLACGKGGDLGKWIHHERGIQNYVGIDVARGSLKDAAIRARSMRDSFKNGMCTFICADLGADRLRPVNHQTGGAMVQSEGNWENTITQESAEQLLCWSLGKESREERGEPQFSFVDYGGISPDESFDVVSIQFAIHYMMSTRQRAITFFRTVSDLLDVGGNLIVTTIDSRVVLEYIMASGCNFRGCTSNSTAALDAKISGADDTFVINIANGTCRLKFHKDVITQIFRNSKLNTFDPLDDQYFGLEYVFTLVEGDDHTAGVGEAVDLSEWLTPLPVLEALATEAGFKLDYAMNFHEFYSSRKNPMSNAKAHSALYHMKVLNRNGTISDDEWEISRLYIALKFTKVSPGKSRKEI